MIRVLLINQGKIPHYRIGVYGYLARYLKRYGFDLIVCAEGFQEGTPHEVGFIYVEIPLSVLGVVKVIARNEADIVIFWVNLRNIYLIPACFIAKCVMGRKIIYWGHGRDLADLDAWIKNVGYAIQQGLSDAIILYAEHLKRNVLRRFHKKIFVANNTLYISYAGLPKGLREKVLEEYDIPTNRNIVCVGRMQKRKRVESLIAAFQKMKRQDIGLVLIGPDSECILDGIKGDNVYKVGPMYGEEMLNLLSACDVFCLPGALGLSIVDAFYCGLPVVTEDGDESPEIMYLKNGVNGFVVERGNTDDMAEKLLLLLDNDSLRERFSVEAKKEIRENGAIDRMCDGFRDALHYVIRAGA